MTVQRNLLSQTTPSPNTKIDYFLGWVEVQNPTFALGCASLHPTYKQTRFLHLDFCLRPVLYGSGAIRRSANRA